MTVETNPDAEATETDSDSTTQPHPAERRIQKQRDQWKQKAMSLMDAESRLRAELDEYKSQLEELKSSDSLESKKLARERDKLKSEFEKVNSELQSRIVGDRRTNLADAISKTSGVNDTALVRTLLLGLDGEDTAPETFDDERVGQLSDALKKKFPRVFEPQAVGGSGGQPGTDHDPNVDPRVQAVRDLAKKRSKGLTENPRWSQVAPRR